MLPRITNARHVDGYTLELTFSDGASGKIDFRDRVVGRGGLFKALADVLYSLATGQPLAVLQLA